MARPRARARLGEAGWLALQRGRRPRADHASKPAALLRFQGGGAAAGGLPRTPRPAEVSAAGQGGLQWSAPPRSLSLVPSPGATCNSRSGGPEACTRDHTHAHHAQPVTVGAAPRASPGTCTCISQPCTEDTAGG